MHLTSQTFFMNYFTQKDLKLQYEKTFIYLSSFSSINLILQPFPWSWRSWTQIKSAYKHIAAYGKGRQDLQTYSVILKAIQIFSESLSQICKRKTQ